MTVIFSLVVGAAAASVCVLAAGRAAGLLARARGGTAGEPGAPCSASPADGAGWFGRILAGRRLARIRAGLPEALTGLATSVRAGLSLPQAVQAAGRQVPGPLGHEFRVLAEAVSLGATLEQSLDAFEARVRVPEVRLLVSGLKLARSTGGSLAPLLDRLAESLRERERQRARVAALTAQGRLSGWVVGLMPVVLLGIMALLDPSFAAPMLATPVGWVMLAVAAALEGMGVFMIRAVARVEP